MYFNSTEIGLRVRELRVRKGLSVNALAEELNCSREHMSRAEHGKESYSIDLHIDLAQYFDVSLDYLILGIPKINDEAKAELLQVINELSHIAMKL